MGADFIPCRGMIKGTSSKDNFWFFNTRAHICGLGHAGDQSSIDNRLPLLNITAAPSWGIANKEVDDLKKHWNCMMRTSGKDFHTREHQENI